MGFSEPPDRSPQEQSERDREIARRRDALLADARGERRKDDDGGSAARLGGLGVQFVVALLLFLYLGSWVDRRFGSGPWGMIGGLCVGFGSGFYLMMRALKDENRREDERKTTGKGS